MRFIVVTAIFAGVLSAQEASLKARELFYTPPPDAKPAPKPAGATKKVMPARIPVNKTSAPYVNAANVPLGLRYSVLKRDPTGKFAEVDADATFRSGDRIRLKVDTNTPGYLYVVMQGSSGNWRLLFPSSEVDGGNNRIDKGAPQQIPAGEKGQFVFDQQSGTEKLFLVVSRQPEADLDKLIYSITGASTADRTLVAQASVGNDVVDRLREEVKSRDLIFEKVDGAEAEKATYVVNPSRTGDARLVVDVALKHGK